MSKNQVKLSRIQGVVEHKKTDKSVTILDVVINGTRKSQVLRKIAVQRKNLLHVATVNPEFVMEARTNTRFRTVLSETALTVADGWGMIWALRLTQGKLIERVTGVELVEAILKMADRRREKVFLLGAGEGVAEEAARSMQSVYPGAKLSWYAGARTVALEKSEEASMTIAKINSVEPDYLLVAYGSPWQDIWIEENKEYLRVRVAIGVGGTLDEWAGVVRTCPTWIDRLGCKWLFRLVTQPRIRAKRVLNVLRFATLVIYQSLID